MRKNPYKWTRAAVLAALAWLMLFSATGATIEGVIHLVREGDTLWDISRTYGVSTERIRAENRELANTNMIRPGQRIFIPGAGRIKEVEPLTRQMREIMKLGRSGRWEYIVIHHSATAAGSARLFERSHRQRGFRCLGYHFVVANGTDNTSDGEIEIGFRWSRQWDGAHTRGNMNSVGIGICLVGNFEETKPTQKQMDSLVSLSTQLAQKYNIPLENIRGHRDFANNSTMCPGKNFPWDEFRKALADRGVF